MIFWHTQKWDYIKRTIILNLFLLAYPLVYLFHQKTNQIMEQFPRKIVSYYLSLFAHSARASFYFPVYIFISVFLGRWLVVMDLCCHVTLEDIIEVIIWGMRLWALIQLIFFKEMWLIFDGLCRSKKHKSITLIFV